LWGKIGTIAITESRFHEYPKAARHFTSLFPNNYLDIVELKDEVRLSNFTERTYRIRRKLQRDNAQLLLHYDNVIDEAEKIIGQETY